MGVVCAIAPGTGRAGVGEQMMAATLVFARGVWEIGGCRGTPSLTLSFFADATCRKGPRSTPGRTGYSPMRVCVATEGASRTQVPQQHP